MSRWVALLLFIFLVGCGATTRGVRPGAGQDTRRSGLPVATQALPSPPPLQGITGEGLGNGLPRAVLRLVPQGTTTATEATTGERQSAGKTVPRRRHEALGTAPPLHTGD